MHKTRYLFYNLFEYLCFENYILQVQYMYTIVEIMYMYIVDISSHVCLRCLVTTVYVYISQKVVIVALYSIACGHLTVTVRYTL